MALCNFKWEMKSPDKNSNLNNGKFIFVQLIWSLCGDTWMNHVTAIKHFYIFNYFYF